uniref:Uncharacterized protein n=1 Tax=Rhizophora mucronata TaxID=61149 RepID=A0A2P2N7W1_RHIMU
MRSFCSLISTPKMHILK